MISTKYTTNLMLGKLLRSKHTSATNITIPTTFYSGQPKETIEASFDIISDIASSKKLMLIDAEVIHTLCRVMAILTPQETRAIEIPPIFLQSPIWFLRLSHTHLCDGEVQFCYVSVVDVPPNV